MHVNYYLLVSIGLSVTEVRFTDLQSVVSHEPFKKLALNLSPSVHQTFRLSSLQFHIGIHLGSCVRTIWSWQDMIFHSIYSKTSSANASASGNSSEYHPQGETSEGKSQCSVVRNINRNEPFPSVLSLSLFSAPVESQRCQISKRSASCF